MSILIKSGFHFMSGMFWQIPDEGKRAINLQKILKDTGNDMYCRTTKITPTYGFCKKEALPKNAKVASLAQFIVECSFVNEKTPNSIIAYRFKNRGELDENGNAILSDLFGYVVFLNGTICADDGEFCSDIVSLKINLLKKVRKYQIRYLSLPIDVVGSLFNVYERLSLAYNYDKPILLNIYNHITNDELIEINNFLKRNSLEFKYGSLFSRNFSANSDDENSNKENLLYDQDLVHNQLLQFIREKSFVSAINENREAGDDLMVLPEKIAVFGHTSDEIYWKNGRLNANFNKALIKPVSSIKKNQYKMICLIGLIVGAGYFAFAPKKPDLPLVFSSKSHTPAGPIAVNPEKLISACIVPNDKYFKDSDKWQLKQLSCNSQGYHISFNVVPGTTLEDLIKYTGEKDSALNGNNATVNKRYALMPGISKKEDRTLAISKLQTASQEYSFSLTGLNNSKDNKFTIQSKLSPIFLVKHGILDDLKVISFSAELDQSSGFYKWTIQGEINS